MIQGKTIAVHYSNRKQKFENWLCNAVSDIFELIPQYFSFFLFVFLLIVTKTHNRWLLQCGLYNFRKRLKCFRCGASKVGEFSPLRWVFLSLCENKQFIIYPAWWFLALLFVGDSTGVNGVNGLNVESQQPGEYSGDSKWGLDRKGAKQKMCLV